MGSALLPNMNCVDRARLENRLEKGLEVCFTAEEYLKRFGSGQKGVAIRWELLGAVGSPMDAGG